MKVLNTYTETISPKPPLPPLTTLPEKLDFIIKVLSLKEGFEPPP